MVGRQGGVENRWGYWLALFLSLVALAGLLYFPSLDDFFFGDDMGEISFSMLDAPRWLSGTFDVRVVDHWFRPIKRIIFLVNFHLFDLNPVGYHVVNLGLHILNGLLLGLAMALWTGRRFLGFLASLVFVSHPAYSETVSWIAGVNELTAVFFYLLCLIFWAWYLKRGGRRRYIGTLIAFSGALLAKETTALLPALMLLYEVITCGPRLDWRRLWVKHVPFGAIWALYLVMELVVQSRSYLMENSRYTVGWHALRNLGDYLAMLAYPVWPIEGELEAIAARVGMAVLAIVLAYYLVKGRAIQRFLVALTLVGILPFIFFREGVWPRYSYMGGLGFAAIAGSAIWDGSRALWAERGRDLVLAVLVVLVSGYAVQTRDYQDAYAARSAIYEESYRKLEESAADVDLGEKVYFVNSPFDAWMPTTMLQLARRNPYLEGILVMDGARLFSWGWGENRMVALEDGPLAGPLHRDDGTHLIYFEGSRLGKEETGFEGWRVVDGPSHLVMVEFGGLVRLIGYDVDELASEGSALNLVLYWQRLGELDRQHSAFVHLIDDEWRMWGQADGIPRVGADVSDEWGDGRMLRDARTIAIPADVPSGTYRLEIGVYRPDTMERLKLEEAGQGDLDDRVLTVPVVAP